MEYRKLGSTDLELSTIAYGAFAIGGTMWGGNKKRLYRIDKSLNRQWGDLYRHCSFLWFRT